MSMEGNNFVFGYCLTHERPFPIFELHQATKISETVYVHPTTGLEGDECPGPIVFNEPPPPLSEEEWEIITEKEYHRYASEV